MKKNKNVLMITSTGLLGGGPKQISFLLSKLKNRINIHLACPKNNIFELDEKIEKKKIIYIKERRISFDDFLSLYKYVKNQKIDIVHSHGKGASIYGRLLSLVANIPHIYTFHGIHLTCHSLIYKIFYVAYENIFGFLDNYKIFVSKSEILSAKSNFLRIGRKSKVIFNGVEVIDEKIINITNYELKKRLKIKKDDIVVTNICRFVNQKNIFDFLKIANKCEDIYFFLIGYGKLDKNLKRYVYENKINNVFFLGQKKNVYKFLSITDIFLSTSLYEGLPIALLEAMSMQIPLVASDVYGHIDLIDNFVSGFLYDIKDLNQATSFIKLLAKNKKLRKFLGRNARKKQVNQFSINTMCNEHFDLYLGVNQR